jgi:hypothetical protein
MKKPTKFFFGMTPSRGEPKRNSPTHYATNRGLVKIRWDIVQYFYTQFLSGNCEPELFICAWYDFENDEINVGLEIPRVSEKPSSRRVVSSEDHEPYVRKKSPIELLFEDSE